MVALFLRHHRAPARTDYRAVGAVASRPVHSAHVGVGSWLSTARTSLRVRFKGRRPGRIAQTDRSRFSSSRFSLRAARCRERGPDARSGGAEHAAPILWPPIAVVGLGAAGEELTRSAAMACFHRFLACGPRSRVFSWLRMQRGVQPAPSHFARYLASDYIGYLIFLALPRSRARVCNDDRARSRF